MHSVPELASDFTCFADTKLLPGLGLWTETTASNQAHAADETWHCWFHVHLKKGFSLSSQGEVTANKSSTPFPQEDWNPGSTGMFASAAAQSTGPVLEASAGQGFISGRCLFYLRTSINQGNPISLALLIELTLLRFYPLTVETSISPSASKH